jgi:hypothetical protein
MSIMACPVISRRDAPLTGSRDGSKIGGLTPSLSDLELTGGANVKRGEPKCGKQTVPW